MDEAGSGFGFHNTGFPQYDMGLARYRMDDGAFLAAHDFGVVPDINYVDVELLGSALYATASFSGSVNVHIPGGGPVLTSNTGALAVVKYCHVPEQVNLSVAGPELVLCPGTETTLTGSGAEQYNWYTVADAGVPFATGTSITLLADTSFTLYLEGVNGTCAAPRIPLSVVVRPVVDITEEQVSVCAGDTVLLHYTGLADSFVASAPAVFTTGLPFHADGVVWIQATDVATGCVTSDTAWVTVLERPFVDLVLSPDSVCVLTGSVPLTGGSPAGGTWSSTGEMNGDEFWPLQSGLGFFTVSYTVLGDNGCTATASDLIQVANCIGTGMHEASTADLRVFPVPADGELTVVHDAGIRTARLLDATGRIVRTTIGLGAQRIGMDVSGLAPGRYVLQVISADGVRSVMPVLLAR